LVSRVRGPASRLHSRPFPDARSITFYDVDRPALVLGSAQADVGVDPDRAAAAGIDVVRRRSGGGAVWLAPGSLVWADLYIPRTDDPLWDDDVGRSMWWVGETWSSVVGPDAEVWRGAMVETAWSRQVCFAGLGPGEVTLGGRKVVGISQRRTGEGALFQTACLLQWDPAPLVEWLGLEGAELGDVAVAVDRPAADVESALVDALP